MLHAGWHGQTCLPVVFYFSKTTGKGVPLPMPPSGDGTRLLLDAFECDDEADLVAYHADHFIHGEIGALDGEVGLDAGALGAGWELAFAGELDGDGDAFGDAVEGEVAGDVEHVIRGAFFHGRALEGDGGVLLGIEEVG